MGNGVSGCCAVTTAGDISKRYDVVPVHDNLGHSFCYVGPVLNGSRSSFQQEPSLRLDSIPGATTTTFSISGASVSANTSTALSAGSPSTDASLLASGFESSNRFASLPLKPVPRSPSKKPGHGSGVFERRFLSGPNESGLVSGPVPIPPEAAAPSSTMASTPRVPNITVSQEPVDEHRETNTQPEPATVTVNPPPTAITSNPPAPAPAPPRTSTRQRKPVQNLNLHTHVNVPPTTIPTSVAEMMRLRE
ncbi:hypothetical protein F2Q70_00009748 [Brassica cretica]|uniref:Uncharacterized protein n=1 Tax=Brassica cretica TaxID=69181 RepID=A0A8S9M7Z2_BRACR|nr:hypothetical protein F2Q70_00009748 [Brassica cretica]